MNFVRGLGYAAQGAQQGFNKSLSSMLMYEMINDFRNKRNDKKKAEEQKKAADASAKEFDSIADNQPDYRPPQGNDDLAAQEASAGGDFNPYTSPLPEPMGMNLPEMADGGRVRRGLTYAADGVYTGEPAGVADASKDVPAQQPAQQTDNPFVAYAERDPEAATDFFERMNNPEQRSRFLMGMAMVNFAATEGKEGLSQMVGVLNHIEQFRKSGGIKALALADSGDYQGAMEALQQSGMYKGVKGMRPTEVVVGKNPYNGEDIKRRVYEVQTEGGIYQVDPVKVSANIAGAATMLEQYNKNYFSDPMKFAEAAFNVEKANRGLKLQEDTLQETKRNHGLMMQRYDEDRKLNEQRHRENLADRAVARAQADAHYQANIAAQQPIRDAREDELTKGRLTFMWGADKPPKELKPDEMMGMKPKDRDAYNENLTKYEEARFRAQQSFSLFDYNRSVGSRISPTDAATVIQLIRDKKLNGDKDQATGDYVTKIDGRTVRIPSSLIKGQ